MITQRVDQFINLMNVQQQNQTDSLTMQKNCEWGV